MKFSLGISNFLEGISSLSHSIVFLYFFALTTDEGFLAILWNSVFKWIIFPFLCCFSLLFFSQLFVRSSQTTTLPFCISFSCRWSYSSTGHESKVDWPSKKDFSFWNCLFGYQRLPWLHLWFCLILIPAFFFFGHHNTSDSYPSA